jgi:hypothetical protein
LIENAEVSERKHNELSLSIKDTKRNRVKTLEILASKAIIFTHIKILENNMEI